MKSLLVAAAGSPGAALNTAFAARGDTVLSTGRNSRDFPVELADPAGVEALDSWAGKVDAVAGPVGVTPVKPVQEMTADSCRRWPPADGGMVSTGSGDVGARHHSRLGHSVRSASTRGGGGVGITWACIPAIVARAPPDCRDYVVEAVMVRKRTRGKGWDFSLAVSMANTWPTAGDCFIATKRFGLKTNGSFR
jgi:hypothetical protein